MDCPPEICIIRTAGILLTISSLIAGIYYIGIFRSLSGIQTPSGQTEDEIFYCVKKSDAINGYRCVDNYCEKTVIAVNTNSSTIAAANATCLTSFNVCQLLCRSDYFLWPVPTKNVTTSSNLSAVDPKKIYFKNDIPPGNSKKLFNLLEDLKEYFVDIMANTRNTSGIKNARNIFITFKCKNDTTILDEHTDESYEIKLETKNDRVHALINANTYFGVRHGTETLSQLILFDDVSKTFVMPKEGFIADAPAYRYRGIMLDTASNYYSVRSVKRTLDAMAINKLNVFHWRLIGSASFPFVSKKHPDMSAIGAFSSDQVYTKDDVKDIRKYAKVRGIRIIPELEIPAPIGEGWQHLTDSKIGENFMLCYPTDKPNDKLIEPAGQLNPTLDGVYELLVDLYKELGDWFETNLFHIGAGNVDLNCWNTTQIHRWMSQHNTVKNIGQLEDYFYDKIFEKLNKTNKDALLVARQGPLTTSSYLNKLDEKKFIFQIRDAERNIDSILKKNYQLIVSNYPVLNLNAKYNSISANGTVGNEIIYNENNQYKKIYYNSPLQLIKNATLSTLPESKIKERILGAEAILWSNETDENTIDAKLWPRCCALAERIWSDSSMDWADVKNRLKLQRQRMTSRSISADVMGSVWCLQHPIECTA